jgi:hypothetical protein
MTQAGTMDLGGSAQSKQSGSPWGAIALTLAVVVAMIGAVGFALSAGLVGGTSAKPAADRSYDAILDKAHATPYARGAALSTDEYLNSILDRAHATPFVVHPGKAADDLVFAPVTVPLSPTSGTFHAGKAADDQVLAPVNLPGVSGP